MALVKLHKAIEKANYDPREQFFQWNTMNEKSSKRRKMTLLLTSYTYQLGKPSPRSS